jgi:hypothetical protein
MKILRLIILVQFCSLIGWGQNFNLISLTWQESSNRMAKSCDIVWVGNAASHNYQTPYSAVTNGLVMGPSFFAPNCINYVAVQQISTNPAGMAVISELSGEIQIQSTTFISASSPTDAVLLVSSDLGQTWSSTGTNLVLIPASEKAQQFFRGKRATNAFSIQISKQNLLSLPSPP